MKNNQNNTFLFYSLLLFYVLWENMQPYYPPWTYNFSTCFLVLYLLAYLLFISFAMVNIKYETTLKFYYASFLRHWKWKERKNGIQFRGFVHYTDWFYWGKPGKKIEFNVSFSRINFILERKKKSRKRERFL